jgi:phosphoglycerate dehydrogenase-like enzyme
MTLTVMMIGLQKQIKQQTNEAANYLRTHKCRHIRRCDSGEGNLRMATVIGLVGAGGIGQELKGRFDMFQYGHVCTILLAIFIAVFLLDQFSARLRAKLI